MSSYTNQIAFLFTSCTELRETFICIEKQADMVHELSLNASLAAAQTGTHVKTCAEIANQISKTGRRMRLRVNAIRDEVNLITNLVLEALVHEQRLSKYREASRDVKGFGNQRILDKKIEQYIEQAHHNSLRILTHVHKTRAWIHSLDQCLSCLFAALSAFEIESVDLRGHELQAIASMVENLHDATDNGSFQIQRIAKVVARIKSMILSMQESSHKELVHAKIRAA